MCGLTLKGQETSLEGADIHRQAAVNFSKEDDTG